MEFEQARQYMLGKPEAIEDFPFGPDTWVYKLQGKVFAILGEHKTQGWRVNLKCDPDQALALRDIFEGVIPGYHMNKKHWNTLLLDSDLPDSEIERLIDHSFALILGNLPKARQAYMRTHYPLVQLTGIGS